MYRELNLRDLRLLESSLSKYIEDNVNGVYYDIDFNPGYKELEKIQNMKFEDHIQYISLRYNMKVHGADKVLCDLRNQIYYKEGLQDDFLMVIKGFLR